MISDGNEFFRHLFKQPELANGQGHAVPARRNQRDYEAAVVL